MMHRAKFTVGLVLAVLGGLSALLLSSCKNPNGVLFPALVPPARVQAVAGNQQATVGWDAVPGAASYNLYWGTLPFNNPNAATAIVDVHSPFLHSGLTNGMTYYYRVAAVASSQVSALSAQVSATPTAGPAEGYVEGYLLLPSGAQGAPPAVSCGAPAGYAPLVGAGVTLSGGGSTLTTASGYFRVAGPPGSHALNLSASDFIPVTVSVSVPSSGGAQAGTMGCLTLPKGDTTGFATSVPTVSATSPLDIEIKTQVADSTGTQMIGIPPSAFAISIGDSLGQNFQSASVTAFTQQMSGSANYQEFTAVLVLDASGSMLEPANPQNPTGPSKLDMARQAAQYFVQNKQPGDAVALVIFDHRVTYFQDFTTNTGVLLQKLQCYDSNNGTCWGWGGSTALWDAMDRSLEALETQAATRKYVVVLSDGKDNSSLHTPTDIIARANRDGAAIDTLGVGSDVDSANLQLIAQSTGGSYMRILDATQIPAAFSAILTQAQNPYSLTVSLPGLSSGAHTLKVDVAHSGLTGTALRLFSIP